LPRQCELEVVKGTTESLQNLERWEPEAHIYAPPRATEHTCRARRAVGVATADVSARKPGQVRAKKQSFSKLYALAVTLPDREGARVRQREVRHEGMPQWLVMSFSR